ncbi:MAG: hypothetical protein HYU66_19370 [Armatimonadetes bacterium]|nr:hypothetical protein [Armatimonadota bacterium]
MTEARIDLHCHTSYSEDREQVALPHGASLTFPFHPTLGPDEVFDRAVARGMTHVTFTDHDTLDGCLDWLARHGPDPRFIPGERSTTGRSGPLPGAPACAGAGPSCSPTCATRACPMTSSTPSGRATAGRSARTGCAT